MTAANITRYQFTLITLLSVIMASCTIVKKAPLNTPYFFENKIKIAGISEKKAVKELVLKLDEQIEDSAKIKKASKIPWPAFPWIIPVPVIESPTPYIESPVKQSVLNMQYLLASLGYRRSTILFDTSNKKFKGQIRTTVEFDVKTGPATKVDTIIYTFDNIIFDSLIRNSIEKSEIQKENKLNYALIDQEIGRLTEILQNSGFARVTKEDIIAEIDTSFNELISPLTDPFSYALNLAHVKQKILQPEAIITFRLRDKRQTGYANQFFVGNIIIQPDSQPDENNDTLNISLNDSLTELRIFQKKDLFETEFIKSQILIKPGNVYNRENYNKTINQLNKLGVWQNINITTDVNDSSKRINYLFKLQPSKKQYFSIDLEGSSIINTSQLVQVGSGRVGLANNFTLRNRNIGKRAIQLENSLRTGIEFNNFQRILSGEITLTNRMTFPKMVAPVSEKLKSYFQQAKTIASVDFSYIDRFRFFQLNTINTFLGYEWKPGPFSSWQFKPINIEYTQFRPDSLFLQSINDFPLLLYAYNNGLIIGMNAVYNKNLTPYNKRFINLLKIYAEESGLLSGSLFNNQTAKGKIFENLYRFVKADVELKHIKTNQKSSLHLRAYAGAGIALNTRSRTGQVTLPFFKSFIAGGPNSMRGWSIRKLGIGSNIFYDTVANGRFNDKYADIQLEGNIEYRFNLFPFYGFWMRGAVFTDVGNIWFRDNVNSSLPGAGFKLSNLGKDLAVASGFGARIDFSYFLLRFDLGFPLKDPRYGPDKLGSQSANRFYSEKSGGWFVKNVWNSPTFQFAIGYPF